MEKNIIITLLEMFIDRNYTFNDSYNPNDILKKVSKNEEILYNIPYINNKITNTSTLPIDNYGKAVYVFIQDGNEEKNQYNDNQTDRNIIIKQIINNLKHAIPQVSSAKKFSEIYEHIHLIFVFNGIYKKVPINVEGESFGLHMFEAIPKYRLRYNLTKNILQPIFRKLSKDEVEEYKEKYQISLPNANLMRINDPINRYYHGMPNDIYEVYRKEGGINYRIVVKGMLYSTDKTDKKL